MSIKIEIRLLGIFQRLSGKKHFNLNLDEPATVRDVISKLVEMFSIEFKTALVDSQLDDPSPNALIILGGKEIGSLQGLETEVNTGEDIVFVPMIHGG